MPSSDTLSFDRINVFHRNEEYDWRARSFLTDYSHYFHKHFRFQHPDLKLVKIRTIKSYFLSNHYSTEQLEEIAHRLLADPISEGFSINQLIQFNTPQQANPKTQNFHIYAEEFDYLVETGYQLGVVDNEGRTFQSALIDYLKEDYKDTQTSSGCVYLLKFNKVLETEQVKKLFEDLLINPLIERLEVRKISDLIQNNKKSDETSKILLEKSLFNEFFYRSINEAEKRFYEVINLTTIETDEELLKLSNQKLLYFNLAEMKAIIDYYSKPAVRQNRENLNLPNEPTDVELEVLAQTWSEHCKHKIFAARIDYYENGEFKQTINSLYKTYIKQVTHEIQKENKKLLSVFSDNSGVFQFDDQYAICMKVETHNSPSALDPFGGAITGIVGVNRDIIGTGIGAQPLFNTDVFCFADPNYDKPIPGRLFHPSRIFQGVHKGVERGGNESGIPTVNGAIVFDDRFLGKPLVFCGTGGIMPLKITSQDNGEKKEINTVEKNINNGDLIAMVGGRIGKDGIHGATFSSMVLEETSPSSVVQIGDPITQKKMLDFILKARDQNLYRTLTDNGAGGLSSSVGELATFTNGCSIHLDRALLKYPGLRPWEILVSESQERMTLVVPPQKRETLESLAHLYDVEICFLGDFNDSGYLSAFYQEEIVACLEMDFLHDGVPQLHLKADWTPPALSEEKDHISQLTKKNQFNEVLKTLLARPNIASKENWVRQYDHEVKTKTILKPFDGVHRDSPMDAAVIKPVFNSSKGLVVSNGLMPRYSDLDAYHMAQASIDEAVRNLVAVGGDPENMYGLDNFCWPDPIASPENLDGQYKLAQLVRANQGIYDLCQCYRLPLISGKDSMKNDYGQGSAKISIPPTLLVTVLSVIEDYRQICSSAFKGDGLIYFLGELKNELGGSEYLASQGLLGSQVPKVDGVANFSLYKAIHQLIKSQKILACHDLSDGGLAVTLAECCFGGDCGAVVDLGCFSNIPNISIPGKLFSESQGCFVAEVKREDQTIFESTLKKYHAPFKLIGKTQTKPVLEINEQTENAEQVINAPIDELKKAWQEGLNF